jgi:phosphoglycerate kinase
MSAREFNGLDDLILDNKSVFLRLDLNTPLGKKGEITDTTRIEAALPTLKHVMSKTSRLVVASHLGRPKGVPTPSLSLEPVAKKLAEFLECEVALSTNYTEAPVDQLLRQLGKNRIILLENLRFNKGETDNDPDFAKILGKGIDVYIDDAFGAMHREHASVVALAEQFPKEQKGIGLLVAKEVEALDKLKSRSEPPFVVVMGGSKVSDKLSVILSMIERCNTIVIGGAMAYTFLKFQGINVGKSRVEPDMERYVETVYNNAAKRRVSIVLPIDHVCAPSLDITTKPVVCDRDIPDDLAGYDIGPRTIFQIKDVLSQANTVFWNGPLGVFENPAFAQGTLEIARAMGRISAYTVVGGGDSVAAVNMAGVASQLDHVSTGGGASLEYLEGKRFPGLRALVN